jgi:hypothetical protein
VIVNTIPATQSRFARVSGELRKYSCSRENVQ